MMEHGPSKLVKIKTNMFICDSYFFFKKKKWFHQLTLANITVRTV
jgi:hypothetical protein